MTNINKEAKEYASNHNLYGSIDWDEYNSFVAGARYVLDAMTSEDAVRVINRVRILRTSTAEQLAAVRKEIEGE